MVNHDKVTELLKNYRSYKYAAQNCGPGMETYRLPLIISERRADCNMWDATRYNRIVTMVAGAVNEVLSDDERTVIMRKYFDRNTLTLNEIADALHKDPSTISRWHKAAIRRLSIALQPLTAEEAEINNFDHMFNPNWKFTETA